VLRVGRTESDSRLWGSPSHFSNGYRGGVPGVKQPGREAHHLPLSKAKVKNWGDYLHSMSSWHGKVKKGKALPVTDREGP
jgi:hypothetical protein